MSKIMFAAAIAVLLLSSCDRKNDPTSRSGSSITDTTQACSLELSPADSNAHLVCSGLDINSAKVEWLLNGAIEESVFPLQFEISHAKKGDTLQARIHVQDQEILSNSIEIGNSPPEITSINLIAAPANPDNFLAVQAAGHDPDGDTVTFQYEWSINGVPAGTEEGIGNEVKRGDVVVVKVTPTDGNSYGHSMELKRTIENCPPIIHPHSVFQFDGSVYKYQVKADDRDGDLLSYSIESTVQGMTIDKSSGFIAWNVPPEFKGIKSVPVIVTDGHGGSAKYILNITIQ